MTTIRLKLSRELLEEEILVVVCGNAGTNTSTNLSLRHVCTSPSLTGPVGQLRPQASNATDCFLRVGTDIMDGRVWDPETFLLALGDM